jgi:MFS family permease
MPRAQDREFPDSIEGRASWATAFLTLAILSVSYGAALIVVVGLKPIAASLSADRSAIALAGAFAWLGMGVGGILMGWAADFVGVKKTIVFGAAMVAAGLALSTTGRIWALYVGHGILIGVLGNGAIYPPLVIYVSRWFDRRRGTAIALISAGQYIAGMLWPSIFEAGLSHIGWRATMLGFAGLTSLVIAPLALLLGPPCRAPTTRHGCSDCLQTWCRRSYVSPGSSVACRWRCRRRISSHSAAISAFRRRKARRCCRCCWARPS